MRALILAVAAKFEPREAADAFVFLVSLGVRLVIATTVRSGSVETPLSTAAREIFAGNIGTAAQLQDQLKTLTPSDSQFREAFERALGPLLPALARNGRQGRDRAVVPAQDDRAIINLEHVLPQKPEDNWPHITDEDVAQYSKRLGSLVLMRASDNSHAKSAGFGDKREIYGRSPYVLTSQIAERETWDVDSIVERQKRLAELAVKAWPV